MLDRLNGALNAVASNLLTKGRLWKNTPFKQIAFQDQFK